ncbi:MAG: metalloregulator ArsR/SmtB family transcription factor [Actinomycetota bacterium]
MSRKDLDQLAWTFKALGYRRRLEILDLIISHKDICVIDIADKLNIPPNTVSQNLAVLARTGMVTTRNRGTYVYYRIKTTGFSARNMFLLWLVIDCCRKDEIAPHKNEMLEGLISGNYKKFLRGLGG